MARILCVWELGANLGHLANLKPFVDEAQRRGHEVTVVAKELQNVHLLFDPEKIKLIQGPYFVRGPDFKVKAPNGHAQLIQLRCRSDEELDVLWQSWNTIFGLVQPDLVIYDYAPTAMIASLHKPWKKWIIGSGFLVPRTDHRFYGGMPGLQGSFEAQQELKVAEENLIEQINRKLSSNALPAISSLHDLVRQMDRQILLTLPELDHFGGRAHGDYVGIPVKEGGVDPGWPEQGKVMIFAYLSKFSGLEVLLELLNKPHYSVIVYSRNISSKLKKKFEQIRFFERPLDMVAVKRHAHLAITMAGHGTMAECLLENIPQLMIPLSKEQQLLAFRVRQMGMGVLLSPQPEKMKEDVINALKLVADKQKIYSSEYARDMTGAKLNRSIVSYFDEFDSTITH